MAVLKTTSPRLSFGAPKLLPSKTVPSSRARIAAFNSDCPPVFSGRGVSHIEACRGARINKVEARLLTRHPPGVLRVDVLQCTTSGRLRVCCWRAVQKMAACLRVLLEP